MALWHCQQARRPNVCAAAVKWTKNARDLENFPYQPGSCLWDKLMGIPRRNFLVENCQRQRKRFVRKVSWKISKFTICNKNRFFVTQNRFQAKIIAYPNWAYPNYTANWVSLWSVTKIFQIPKDPREMLNLTPGRRRSNQPLRVSLLWVPCLP